MKCSGVFVEVILNGILAEGVLCDSVGIVWTGRYREVRGRRCVVIRISKRCCVCFVMKNSFDEFRMENARFSCSHMIIVI